MKKEKLIKCPHCQSEFNYYNSEYRPFCSEKCKLIDLGDWLTEGYKVASQEPLSEVDIEVILREKNSGESE